MFNTIQHASRADSQLAKLLSEAREFAQVYVIARQRQKGCDGMGELATMKEEFRDVVDRVIQYSQEKNIFLRMYHTILTPLQTRSSVVTNSMKIELLTEMRLNTEDD